MSTTGLNQRNPYGNPTKTTQAKRPLKNPFANINVRQDEMDNDFQPLEFSSKNDNIQSPFQAKNQENSSNQKAFFDQPVTQNRKQPFENRSSAEVVRRSNNNEGRDQGSMNVSNIYPGQNQPMANPNSQEPYFANNSFVNSLSTINNFFGGNQPKPEQQSSQPYDEDNEPPLLEDLGVDINLIKQRTLAVLKFKELDEKFAADADMSGPLLIALAFGSLLLMNRKIHFGYIYGFGVIGTICIYMIMNLLSQHAKAKLYNTMSILGYCLIPITILSAINVILDLVTWYGFVLCLGTIVWSTIAATRFFKVLLNLDQQKYLVGYPIFLFYLVFVLITIF